MISEFGLVHWLTVNQTNTKYGMDMVLNYLSKNDEYDVTMQRT